MPIFAAMLNNIGPSSYALFPETQLLSHSAHAKSHRRPSSLPRPPASSKKSLDAHSVPSPAAIWIETLPQWARDNNLQSIAPANQFGVSAGANSMTFVISRSFALVGASSAISTTTPTSISCGTALARASPAEPTRAKPPARRT